MLRMKLHLIKKDLECYPKELLKFKNKIIKKFMEKIKIYKNLKENGKMEFLLTCYLIVIN